MRDAGKTVLSEPRPRELERSCDRVLLLEHGVAAALGKPEEVIPAYRGNAARVGASA